MPFDPLTIVMLVLLALLIFFMFRNSRKRQKDMAALQAKIVPGANVMTNFGVYGTVISIGTSDDEALVETTPGTVLRVHKQTIARVIDTPEQPVAESSPVKPAEDEQGEPEYGERISDTATEVPDESRSGEKASGK